MLRHDGGRRRVAALLMLIGAALGLLASFVLSVESLILARDANAVLSCSISAVINCATVANHWSAAVLGVPNSFLGMMAMSVMVTVAVVLLAGVKLPRWFMALAGGGVAIGAAAAAWMFYMSYAQIGVLCPWCLVLDVGMLLMVYGLQRVMVLGAYWHVQRWQVMVRRGYDTAVLLVVLLAGAAVIMAKFGEQLL